MDILTDKYKKIEGETAVPNNVQAGEMMAFVTVEEPALEDLDDGECVCGGVGVGGKREILSTECRPTSQGSQRGLLRHSLSAPSSFISLVFDSLATCIYLLLSSGNYCSASLCVPSLFLSAL